MLSTDEGARKPGEFAFGTNYLQKWKISHMKKLAKISVSM